MRSFGIYISDQILFGSSNQREREMTSACGVCDNEKQSIKVFSEENLNKGHYLEDQGINGRKDIYSEYQKMVQLKDIDLNGTYYVLPCFILSSFQETEYIHIVVFMLQAQITKFHTRLCSNSAFHIWRSHFSKLD
jgi:hypothetical protein